MVLRVDEKSGKPDIIDSMPVGVLIVDEDMKVIRFNQAMAEQLHTFLSSPLSEGIEFSRIMADEKVILMLVGTISGNALSMFGYQPVCKAEGAEDRYFDLISSPLKAASGASCGAVVVAIDATGRRRYIEDLRLARNETDFYVDLMSHDIRNFNQITMGYIELLQLSDRLSAEDSAYLEKAQKGVTGSNKLIDNIKKVRMIRQFAGKELKRMDLGEILRQDAEAVKTSCPASNIIFSDSVMKERRSVMVDEYVHDIFRHILENAVKYDPHEQKLIEVDASETIEHGCAFWIVRIADNGVGVPDDKKRSIFERITKTTKGAGLGLSIVSLVVEKYRGRIWVEDRVKGDPTKGSIFTVMLPCA
jgi:signal transduction histidine kinase